MRIVRTYYMREYFYNLIKTFKVVCYCRISTKKQKFSLEAQAEYLKQIARDNFRWEYIYTYFDIGSGLSLKRIGLSQMIKDAHANKFDIILIKSISRLSRNFLDLNIIIRELRRINVRVIFDKEYIDTDKIDSDFRMQITALFAEEESKGKSDSIKWGLRKKYKQGIVNINCKNFLGYDNDADGKMIINERQAIIVRRIFIEFLNGKTLYSIAKGLEKDKIATGFGRFKWYPNKIKQILKNEKYMGDVHLNKYITTDIVSRKVIKNNGQVKSYYVENNHPAIISQDDFNKVQKIMQT